MTHHHKPIPIAALGIDTRTERMLEMIFGGPGKGAYVLVDDPSKAEAVIFDLDSLQAKTTWQEYRTKYTRLPTIVLSLTPKDIPDTIHVNKPIIISNLLKSLDKVKRLLREEAAHSHTAAAHTHTHTHSTTHKETGTEKTEHPVKLATEILLEKEEETLHLYCGYQKDINPNNSEELDKIYYEPQNYLQGFFERVSAYAELEKIGKVGKDGVFIEGLLESVIVIPEQNCILFGGSCQDDKLRTMTTLPLSNNRLRMHTITEAEIKKRQTTGKFIRQPLDNFLWKIALWTARGRIPKGTELDKDIMLLQWPNFTRLIVTPHALEISALWSTQPYSLLETAKILQIPQRYVFAFFSATRAIKLTFVDRQTDRSKRSSLLLPSGSPERSVLKRILSKIMDFK